MPRLDPVTSTRLGLISRACAVFRYSTRRAASPKRFATDGREPGPDLAPALMRPVERMRTHRTVLREESPVPAVLPFPGTEVLVHPARRRRARSRGCGRTAREDTTRRGAPHRRPSTCRGTGGGCAPTGPASRRGARRALADVLHEHPLVVDDVEVVDPHLEAQIDVLAARDLVLLAPRAELPDDVDRRDVDDRGGRCRERRQHLDVFARLVAHVRRVARRGERGHDDRRVRVGARGLDERCRPPGRQHRVVVAERDVAAARRCEALVHAAREAEVRLVAAPRDRRPRTRVVRGLPLRAVVDDDELVGHVGVAAHRLDELLRVQQVVPREHDDRQLGLGRRGRARRRRRAHAGPATSPSSTVSNSSVRRSQSKSRPTRSSPFATSLRRELAVVEQAADGVGHRRARRAAGRRARSRRRSRTRGSRRCRS